MTDANERLRAAFRINLEQQKKRAKELLQAAKSGDAPALQRFERTLTHTFSAPDLKLADAQFVLAREIGLPSWTELKSHAAALDQARRGLQNTRAPDTEKKTLHLRCGSDIKSTLTEAGFAGDFLEHSYPYAYGPVTSGPHSTENQARFVARSGVAFAHALRRRQDEERDLHDSAERYERVVLWMEHDTFDQLVLIRCLAHYATSPQRPILELVNINHFPGSIRFLGLGQLPPEALRMLWERRKPVTEAQLELASATWSALSLGDPRTLASIMRTKTPALPDLAPALHRFLRELPSAEQGLGLTEQLVLGCLFRGELPLIRLFTTLNYEADPLPYATDLMLLYLIKRMQSASEPPLAISSSSRIWDATASITKIGVDILHGALDFMSLRPTPRWVGGVEVKSDNGWRWDERKRDAVLR